MIEIPEREDGKLDALNDILYEAMAAVESISAAWKHAAVACCFDMGRHSGVKAGKMNNLPELWSSQVRAIQAVHDAMTNGQKRICLTVPTGGGKSRIACELIRDWLVSGCKVVLYTNRKMLIDQLSRTLSDFGLSHGLRTADAIAQGEMPSDFPLQIASVQTEHSRSLRKKTWQLHAADRIIVDELHINCRGAAEKIIGQHIEQGAALVGLTATPLDVWNVCDHLIVGATNSELRNCGALVRAVHYGPNEPDTRKIKKRQWDYTENDIRKMMQVQQVFGSILEWFNKLNPASLNKVGQAEWHRPAICFAPGVPESIWLCEEFNKAGISAAHIDGKSCIYNGKRHETTPEIRRLIRKGSQDGSIRIVCNRFVMREGIDWPWISHLVLATVFGSLQSYLQSVGRGLRAFHGKQDCVIQDHGGAWWRHGSANADRHWQVDDTEQMVQYLREESLRNANVNDDAPQSSREPVVCPRCRVILLSMKCSHCGYQIAAKTRPVIQEDGQAIELGGNIFQQRQERGGPLVEELWEKMYYRARSEKWNASFLQAMGLFYHEQGFYPSRTLAMMPKHDRDLFRKVSIVPKEDLYV